MDESCHAAAHGAIQFRKVSAPEKIVVAPATSRGRLQPYATLPAAPDQGRGDDGLRWRNDRVMTARPTAPIIVTALLGASDFAWADGLRRAHFPPERNHIPAHISLFHHLPPARLDELARMMRDLAAEPPPPARLSQVMTLGRGVAYRVESPDLLAMRDHIAAAFAHDLIPQDQGVPRLHITVQNKVEPTVAKALHIALSAEFRPRPLAIAGLAAWNYLGGPWQLAHQIKFRGHRR